MDTKTMLTSQNVKEGESEVVGVNNACRTTNEVMNAWTDAKMVEDIAKDKGEAMSRNKNWVVGERTVGIKTKRVELFIRLKWKEKFYEMKSKAWEM